MLHAVATTPDQAPVPDGLITDGPGEHLWTSVTAEYTLRPDELRVLEDAARLADQIVVRDKLIAEMAASISPALMLHVSGSISTNTGVAPSRTMTSAVATNVNGVVITSSPGPIPSAIRLMSRASVPLATVMQ